MKKGGVDVVLMCVFGDGNDRSPRQRECTIGREREYEREKERETVSRRESILYVYGFKRPQGRARFAPIYLLYLFVRERGTPAVFFPFDPRSTRFGVITNDGATCFLSKIILCSS